MRRVLPPVLLTACIVLMLFLQWVFPVCPIFRFPYDLLGIAPVLAGIVISKNGSDRFGYAQTTIMTFDEPSVLVVDGLYGFSRNPMYLGFALLILGVWVLLGTLSTLYVAVLFILITDRCYIRFEEAMLDRKFGKAYREYKKRVRRWI